ncbi:MAG: ergothioneine biosynthesis protein EgtB [Verrucomicrobiales bacterium]|nr:ergothioneine biosynthesis protein EgtB [Verrucomicrobiales bacterium]
MNLREKLKRDLDESDSRLRELVLTLNDEQLAVPYNPGINPPIWEMGHSAFFFERFLLRDLYGDDPRMPGNDEMWDSFEIPHKERWRASVVPGKEVAIEYYNRVIYECRARLDSPEELTPDEEYLFQYVIAHQNMHVESLIWCRQTLGYPAPAFVEFWEDEENPRKDRGDVEISGGTYYIGKPRQNGREEMAADFCFDNEKPGFEMEIQPFRISRTLVSNAEYLEFVEDGGYENPDFWSFGGKFWLRESEAVAPEYWEKRDGEWWVRRFDQWEKLRPDAPVMHVTFREANAFCQWAGRRLPTEFEWEAAFGRGIANLEGCDLAGRFCGTAPVDALSENDCESGCRQMIGSAWEWTSSQYLPFAGFEVDMYAYMSTLQFATHNTTKGGSWATAPSLIRPTYRQAIYPNRRDMFTGIRTCALG